MTSPEHPLPAPEKARTGRDLQRYSTDGERLLAGCVPHNGKPSSSLPAFLHQLQLHTNLCCRRCIPVRTRSAADGVEGVEVLLVSSRGGKGLVFPKVPL